MRLMPLVTLIIFISLKGYCQNSITSSVTAKEIFRPYYELTEAGGKVLYLPMDYGRSDFSNNQKEAIKRLENAVIVRIDLVYSDYPARTDFSLLTKKRLESLQRIIPKVFLDKSIEFRKIRQTIGKTQNIASGLQHGFFIYFRPLPTKTSGKKEARKLKALLADGEAEKAGDTNNVTWCSQITICVDTNKVNLPVLPEEYTRTITKISVKKAVSRELIEKESEKEYLQFGDSVFCIEDKREDGCDEVGYLIYTPVDSTVTKVFKRHNWKNSFIVVDVTGSMYPYTAQLLKWLQLTLTDNVKRWFLFFNDGDSKDDNKKVIGKTGGIYSVFTNKYDEIERTIITAMENGSGGDLPENNIEALIESDRICSHCDSIVMIADNWAPVKDISFLAGYHKPVKIVLCGVFDKINKDYLKLARETKGSIHLIEEDIYSLSLLKEGETIKIHGVTYKLIEGNFVDM
ncbi:hypothetical protein A4D02_28515 [Niastella koreensis]|uniref:Uncharacterized protein n=2 Tax=Niastella koreensis TaxID=354356 RepID=G8T8I4_NIAKG|nr:hypothetical protein [Niastella koreensis]AEW00156.1 hypothetical protein Niako_3868 [Niastella koreensis GR20-10]OQP49539.1 hypothetical protein A4D02_28515 [Niastella koreensis]